MGYYIDLSTISLSDYKEKLAIAYLPPSRLILREKREERFEYFSGIGIRDVKELLQVLKSKERFDELSLIKCLGSDYLKILLRELKSMLPKPNKLEDFEGVSDDVISKLELLGINNTRKLFDRVQTPETRSKFAEELGIEESKLLELVKLTDLSRIKWVGTTFARILYEIGVDTVERASLAEPDSLHQRVNKIIKDKKLYRGTVSINDICVFIDAAGEIPQDIKY